MRKATVIVGILLILAVSAPLFAQGPFADVPTDHWAYQAINELQQSGVLLGYPDGTFQGKRALTRYEFAVAIARMIPVITQNVLRQVPQAQGGVSREEFNALKEQVNNIKPGTGYATQADLENMRKLMDQFRDELAALGVDVDALKRDVAALTDRVSAIEAEQERVKWNGSFDVFGVSTHPVNGLPVDRDNRVFNTAAGSTDLENNIGVIIDGDMNIRGKLTNATVANATLNFGNYLNYIGFVDDYVDGTRPTVLSGFEQVFPYYLNIDAAFGMGDLQVGRIPVQFTQYTLKKIDVDTYTNILKTDSGDYPMDGAKLNLRFGGINLIGFAAKNNSNEFLANGLTSQPTGGLYAPVGAGTAGYAPFVLTGGHAAGGLASIDQSAGVRALVGTPFKGNLGLTYIRIAGAPTALAGTTYDQADVMGADVNFSLSRFNIGAEYAQTKTLVATGPGGDIDDDNKAIDAKVGFNVGGLGLDLGWKRVERNFSAPGYWDKIGRWANPSNIEGPYLDASYGLTSNVKLVASGAFYSGVDTFAGLPGVINDSDDDLWRATAGLKWGLSPAWSVDAGVEYVRWEPSEVGADNTNEAYYTIGAAWQINPSAGVKLAYQIVDYNAAGTTVPYGADYKGDLAVAEFGVKF